MAFKPNRIRSVRIDYDGLAELTGRNPKGVWSEEELIASLRDAIRGGRGRVHEGDEGPSYSLRHDPQSSGYSYTSS